MAVRRILMVVALMMGSHLVMAQPHFGMEYNGELQADFRGGYNFPNLLRLEVELPLGKHVSFEAASISIAKTSSERLVDDLQTFSNIEEDNLPFAFAVLGASFALGDSHSVHVGLRNVNEDYFTSPVTSLFTGSSCGIFPTISCNYPVANYPLSFFGVHYTFEAGPWQAAASIYDGGIMIGQLAYMESGSSYFFGGCMRTLWAYAEQRVTDAFSLIADYSHAFCACVPCTDFAGMGCRYEFRKAELGVFTDYARFRDDRELATELTLKTYVRDNISVQPTLHVMMQKDMKAAVALVRLAIDL